jgi:hypothetical protein
MRVYWKTVGQVDRYQPHCLIYMDGEVSTLGLTLGGYTPIDVFNRIAGSGHDWSPISGCLLLCRCYYGMEYVLVSPYTREGQMPCIEFADPDTAIMAAVLGGARAAMLESRP